jgi:hypothetical protein
VTFTNKQTNKQTNARKLKKICYFNFLFFGVIATIMLTKFTTIAVTNNNTIIRRITITEEGE